MYRFGDATPFPLDENFIETLAAVVDAAVALFRAETVSDDCHREAREIRRAAAEELRRLEALSALIHDTLGPLLPGAPSSRESDRACQRILEQSQLAIASAREAAVRVRDEATRSALAARQPGVVRSALGRLFASHALPGGLATIEWRAAQPGAASLMVTLQVSRALVVELEGRLEPGDRYAGPIPIDALCPAVASVCFDESVKGRNRPAERLGLLALTDLDLSEAAVRLVLTRPGKRGSVEIARRDGGRPVASWQTPTGEVTGRIPLDDRATEVLDELCSAAAGCRAELLERRARLVAATLHGQTADELEHPGAVAEELLAQVAPLVREMRLRSRVPGELVLKRDIDGDRREELFVPRAALTRRFADLPFEQRRAFEAIGLGDEATTEFRARLARGTEGEGQAFADVGGALPGEPPRSRTQPMHDDELDRLVALLGSS